MKTQIIIASMLLGMLACSSTQADLVLSFVPQGATTVNIGDTIDIDITLTQDGLGSGDESNALTAGFGLTAFGFSLTTDPAFTVSPSGPTNSLPSTWNVSTSPSTISAFELAFPPATPMPLTSAVGTPVTLATFQLTAASAGPARIELADFATGTEQFAFENFGFNSSVNDSGIFSSVSPLNITAVPEPSAFLLFGLIGCISAVKSYVRKRAQIRAACS